MNGILNTGIFRLYLLFILGMPPVLHAQQVHENIKIPEFVWAEQISYREGFNLGISDFCNDHRGMVWAAGTRGLAHFTGAAYQYYFAEDSVHKTGLGKGAFKSLDIDVMGKVWAAGISGVYWFDEVKDSFCFIKSPLAEGWIPAPRVIAFDKAKKNLWLADPRGLYRMDMKTWQWQRTIITAINEPELLHVTQKGWVLVSEKTTSYLYDPENNVIVNRYSDAKSVFETSDAALWLGTWLGGLHRIDPVTLKAEVFYPPSEYKPGVYGEVIFGLGLAPALTGDKILWCGTLENGLYFFDIEQKKFRGNLNYDERLSTGLPDYSVGCIHTDVEGVIWLAQSGLTRIAPFRQQLHAQKIFGLQTKDTREVHVQNILEDRYRPGYQWLATSYYGLVSYNTVQKTVEKWWFYEPGVPILKRERNYRSTIAYDRKGNVWATTETGFMAIDKNQHSRRISIPKYNNGLTGIHHFFFDENNICWMATDLGLCSFSPENQSVHPFINQASDAANKVMDITAGEGGIWLATTSGIHFFDKATSVFKPYSVQANSMEQESLNHFFCLLRSRTGNIYAINSKGLVGLQQGQLKQLCDIPFSHFTHTRAITEDSQGFLWVEAYGGLYKIDPKTGQIVGKFNNEGGFFASFSDANLHLTGYNSIVSFNPATLRNFTDTQKPVFTALKIYDKRFPVHFDSAVTMPIVLNWKQNAVSFEFDCPDFTSFTETTYEVMLEGYDNQWKPQGKKRSITYTNLEPRVYVFYVRATNMTGLKHPENAVFRFQITPPFWKTWWFRLLMLGFISATVYTIFRTRVRAIRREEARKTEFYLLKAETEMRALRAQMNPHFIFNCMNTIEAFIIEQKEDEATGFLQKFSKLIRAVLENSQHDAISLEQEISVLEWYIQLEQIRANSLWQYNVKVAPEINPAQINIPPLILQPFVENAILHGLYHRRKKGGELNISVEKDFEGNVLAIIADNGIGRTAAASKRKFVLDKKSALGVQFSIERVRKMNPPGKHIYDVHISDLYPDQEGMTGTKVEIRLPGCLSNN